LLFPKHYGKCSPEAPSSTSSGQELPETDTTSINPDSLVQSFLIVGKLELPEQVTQAGAWVTAYFSFCDYHCSPARTLGFGKLKHLANQVIFYA
jgi:hypothetical protein